MRLATHVSISVPDDISSGCAQYARDVYQRQVFEIEKSLSGIAHNLISIYNVLDAGDFSQKDDRVYKGETEITSDYRILDDIKNDTGADVTVFVRCV